MQTLGKLIGVLCLVFYNAKLMFVFNLPEMEPEVPSFSNNVFLVIIYLVVRDEAFAYIEYHAIHLY